MTSWPSFAWTCRVQTPNACGYAVLRGSFPQEYAVILVSCNEGLIPHHRAELEEEHRRFYVAMTRASSNLVVSYVKRGCDCEVPPSRFLYEAGLLKKAARNRKKGLTKVVLPPRPVPDGEPGPAPPGGYVASRTSIVFHLTHCGSAKKIADGTLIRYATRAEAIQARKHPCLRCRP